MRVPLAMPTVGHERRFERELRIAPPDELPYRAEDARAPLDVSLTVRLRVSLVTTWRST